MVFSRREEKVVSDSLERCEGGVCLLTVEGLWVGEARGTNFGV